MITIRNVAPGLHASGQPTPGDLAALAARGVRTVINLRTADEPVGYDEPGEADRLGLRYLVIPIAGPQDITPEAVARFSRELETAARHGGTLVHCASSNRVGALIALDRCHAHGASREEALACGRAAGLTTLEPFIDNLLATTNPLASDVPRA